MLVPEAGPDLAELWAVNELHKNVRGSSDVVRVSRVPVYLRDRDPAGPLVLDSGHLAGDGVVVRGRHGVGNPGDHVPTVAQSDDEGAVEGALGELGYAGDIRRTLMHRLGRKSTQPVDIEGNPPLLVAKNVVVAER